MFEQPTSLSNGDSLLIALFVAAIVHIVLVLGINFTTPQPAKVSRSIDITLINTPAKKAPEQANFLAQENQIGAGEFKARCLQLIDEVNRSRVPLIITKHGKPMAKLLPYDEAPFTLYGCMKDSVIINGDIVEGTGVEWEADVC